MRILHCIPSMEGGGAERQLAYLSGALRAAGCDVHVALNQGGPNLAALRDAGATIHQLGLSGNHDIRVVHRLVRVMRAVQPDVVQCWLTQMQVAGGLAAMMTRRPWVFSERSSIEAYPQTFKNRLRAGMGSLASAIVSNSAAGDRYWDSRARQGVRRYVIPNGLPIETIAAVLPATPEQAGLEPGDAFVLFAGRLDEQKNAAAFVQALSRVRTAARVRAMICGEGPLRHDLERQIAGLGLTESVRLTGYTSNLWSLMKRADVLVSTSLCEGNPNVVLEAMACGCPLVVSNIAAHEELLDERSAIVAPPDDPDAVARGIEAVLADPAAAARRARVAAARAETQALHVVAQHYLGVYRDLLQPRTRPSQSPVV